MIYDYNYFKSSASQWNIIFKHDNHWMEKNNHQVAVITRFLIKGNIVTYIVVDDEFFKLSDNCKRFVYNHEIGHYLQYTENRSNEMTGPEKELDADAYSKTRIGGTKYAVSALNELKTLNWDGDKEYVEKIFNKRIECMINKVLTI
jgi:hypothetical protein